MAGFIMPEQAWPFSMSFGPMESITTDHTAEQDISREVFPKGPTMAPTVSKEQSHGEALAVAHFTWGPRIKVKG